MSKVKTPTLDKMLEIQKESELCGKFLDWFLYRYTVFDRRQSREEPFTNVMGNSDYINKEKLLAEFFDIDLEEAEKEKELLLEIERNKHKEHHCVCCGAYIEEKRLKVCNKCTSKFEF